MQKLGRFSRISDLPNRVVGTGNVSNRSEIGEIGGLRNKESFLTDAVGNLTHLGPILSGSGALWGWEGLPELRGLIVAMSR